MPSETIEPSTSISPTPTPSSTSTSTSSNVVIVGSYDSRGITSAAGGNNNNNNNNSGYGDNNNNNMEDSPNFARTTSYDPTPYVQRARVTRAAPPKPACNPLQFVQIKPCNLYQSAQDQLKRAEEVKKVKEIKKEEPEDWQSNLDNWKSCRRKRVEHIIDRVVEVKKLELEEHDRTRRKSKTFSEMLEERGTKGRTKVSLAVYAPVDDDGNDLSDLGIGTSSASGKSSLSEDYDNHSVISDNQDVEKSNTSDFELHNNRNNNHTIKMNNNNNNNNNGNNHQQNITDDDDDDVVGGDGVRNNNNNQEVNQQQQHNIVINNNQNHNNNGNGHDTIEDDDCCLQLNDSIKMLNISRDYASSPGYDTSSSSTAPASSPDPCEYTYEGAIENYKSRILKTTQPPPPPSPRMQIPSSTTTATTITTNKIEERLLKNFELKSPIIDQKDVFSPSSAIGNNKIDVLKRRELFEKESSSYSSASNRQLPSPSTGVINNGIVTASTTKMTSVKERLLNIEKRDDTSIIKDASIVKLNRLSGEFTSNVNNTNYIDGNTNIVKERLVTIEKKNEYNHQGLPNSTTTTNGTNGNLVPINMINKTKIDVPVVPLRDRLLSLQSATTNNQSSSMDDLYQNTNVSESKQSQQPPKQQQAEVIESILNKSTESTATITNIEQKQFEIIEDLPEKCSNNNNNNNNTIINNIPDVIPIIENELIKSNTNTITTTTTTTTKPIDIVESPLESSTLDATETIENKSEISASSSVSLNDELFTTTKDQSIIFEGKLIIDCKQLVNNNHNYNNSVASQNIIDNNNIMDTDRLDTVINNHNHNNNNNINSSCTTPNIIINNNTHIYTNSMANNESVKILQQIQLDNNNNTHLNDQTNIFNSNSSFINDFSDNQNIINKSPTTRLLTSIPTNNHAITSNTNNHFNNNNNNNNTILTTSTSTICLNSKTITPTTTTTTIIKTDTTSSLNIYELKNPTTKNQSSTSTSIDHIVNSNNFINNNNNNNNRNKYNNNQLLYKNTEIDDVLNKSIMNADRSIDDDENKLIDLSTKIDVNINSNNNNNTTSNTHSSCSNNSSNSSNGSKISKNTYNLVDNDGDGSIVKNNNNFIVDNENYKNLNDKPSAKQSIDNLNDVINSLDSHDNNNNNHKSLNDNQKKNEKLKCQIVGFLEKNKNPQSKNIIKNKRDGITNGKSSSTSSLLLPLLQSKSASSLSPQSSSSPSSSSSSPQKSPKSPRSPNNKSKNIFEYIKRNLLLNESVASSSSLNELNTKNNDFTETTTTTSSKFYVPLLLDSKSKLNNLDNTDNNNNGSNNHDNFIEKISESTTKKLPSSAKPHVIDNEHNNNNNNIKSKIHLKSESVDSTVTMSSEINFLLDEELNKL